MFTTNTTCRPVRSSVRLHVEELESRALLSEVGGAVWVGATGDPLRAVRVTLFTPKLDNFWEARTDADGVYWFADVPNGTYRLGVAGRGFEYQEVQVTLKDSTALEWFVLESEV